MKEFFKKIAQAFRRVGVWLKRAFTGRRMESAGVERIEKPSALLKEAFFRKKTAVVALFLWIFLFAFVFVAPLFVPMDINYTDALQQNLPPDYSLRRVPNALKKQIAVIDGFSGFTAGLALDGEVFVWGSSKDRLQKNDLKEIPREVREEGAAFVAAGKDHVLALTKAGRLVGWGDKSCGQYGFEPVLNAVTMPQIFSEGIQPERVRALVCGYQTSALITSEGKAYAWGNKNSTRNLSEFAELENVESISFTSSAAVALCTDGSVFMGKETPFTSAVSLKNGRQNALNAYLVGRKVVAIATTNKCAAFLTEENDLVVSGVFENGEDVFPKLKEGEYFLSIDGGARHFVGVTNYGNAYAWGHNAFKQCALKADGKTAKAFAGAMQSYTINEQGELIQSVGLKGYLMGTDGRGRDVFARLVHGGKMTMTIGGVAVLVSTAIAIVVGCVSGYFGGWVDALLMRVTEIFSSIPFLPFAMLLSQLIKYYNLSETARIFIIMLILGALSWTGLARMIRGQVLAEREKEFVTAAKALGVKEGVIAFRHILPNVVSVLLVSVTLDFAGCLLTESSLSYLGFGVQQPQPTWGNMLMGSNNSVVIQNYWWQWVFPSLFLSLATICINVVGDALRDALDPKSR